MILVKSTTREKDTKSPNATGLTRSTISQRKAIATGQVASHESTVRTSIFEGSVPTSALKAPTKGETRNQAATKGMASQSEKRTLMPLPCALLPSETKIRKQRISPTAREIIRVLFDIS